MDADPVEETVELAGRLLTLLRPASADELIDEEAFDDDEFLPYWAELWPSGVALARAVGELDLRGARVLELGAGLGLPSLAAALGGADVLATDWADDAVELLRLNAGRNRVRPSRRAGALGRPGPAPPGSAVGARARRRPALRAAQRRPAARAAAPARRRRPARRPGPALRRGFLERASAAWRIETAPDAELPSGGLHRLRLR